jgi:very-long-chain (3R)-3-hydroxyacyl-CoA dehydratase
MYLFCYTLFMFCGFLFTFAVINTHYAKDGEEFIPKAYSYIGNVFKMLHLFMFLEVLHPVFGYTRGSVKDALLHVGGRNILLFIMLESEPRMQEKPVVLYLFIIYTIMELIRYPYYMLRTYDIDVGFLTW